MSGALSPTRASRARALSFLLLTLSGCEVPGHSGSSTTSGTPSSGAGGADTSAATTSGTGGGGGEAGEGCMGPEDCEPSASECVVAVCDDGVCAQANVPSGVPLAAQTPNDCVQVACDGFGSMIAEPFDTDFADDGNECTMESCVNGVPFTTSLTGTDCTTNGGAKCHAGICVECLIDADCGADVCQMEVCVPPECINGVKDGAETDIDCGGGACLPCADGLGCLGSGDCTGGVCALSICLTPPSCQSGGLGNGTNCGSASADPCCDRTTIVASVFVRDNWPGDAPATTSAFELETFEVTVARFRTFVASGHGTQQNPPQVGSGAHPAVPGSGWQLQDTSDLPVDTPALESLLLGTLPACDAAFATYTNAAGPNEKMPVNCVPWSVAYAFCIWDGGRLPTDAELSAAFVGGDEQRMHPWGAAPTNPTYASYDCTGDGSLGAQCAPGDILNVGSRPLGAGRWGQQDLLGNVAEWTRDYYVNPMIAPCIDCINLIPPAPPLVGYEYVVRGGGFVAHPHFPETDLDAWNTRASGAPYATESFGLRCAR